MTIGVPGRSLDVKFSDPDEVRLQSRYAAGRVFHFGTINSIIIIVGKIHFCNYVEDMSFNMGSSFRFGSLDFVANKLGRFSLTEADSDSAPACTEQTENHSDSSTEED